MFALNTDLIMMVEFGFTFADSKTVLQQVLKKVLQYFISIADNRDVQITHTTTQHITRQRPMNVFVGPRHCSFAAPPIVITKF